MDDGLLRLVTGLRPATLDQLADDGYAHNRDSDLARTTAEGPRRPSPARRWRQIRAEPGRTRRYLVASGMAAAAAAATAAAVVISGVFPAGRPQQVASTAADAHRFLEASGAIAAQAPATTGAYWYVKERSFAPSVTAKNKSYGAIAATTSENWYGQVHSRGTSNEDVSFSFASAADEARWVAAGEPPLSTDGNSFGSTKPWTRYFLRMGFGVPGDFEGEFTLHQMQRLPATVAGLRAMILRMWNGPDETYLKQGTRGSARPTYNRFLAKWAWVILTGPTTPVTKAAIYQILAGQPGLKIISPVTDPLGRTGVAVMETFLRGESFYLVIDPQTAQLLAITTHPVHADSVIPTAGGGVTVYQQMGWTNKIGVPPQS